MTRKQRLKRVALLCVHFTRNLAYSRAISDLVPGRREGDFWITMQGNCLDVAVLEWCKLFGEHNGKHSWQKIVTDPDIFRSSLLAALDITQADWDACWSEIRGYRNAFVAHLDSEDTMQIPVMDLARRMITFYYDHVLGSDDSADYFHELPKNLNDYYESCYRDAASKTKHNQSKQSDGQQASRRCSKR